MRSIGAALVFATAYKMSDESLGDLLCAGRRTAETPPIMKSAGRRRVNNQP
jgi:hypothetical protein